MLINADAPAKLVYYDYCACIVLGMIFCSTLLRRMTKGRLNRYFLELVVTALLASVADIFSLAHDNMAYMGMTVRNIENTAYLLFHSLTTPIFAVYVTELTDTRHFIKKRKAVTTLMCVPYLLVILALVLNPFNHKLFYFDDTGHYVRGSWFLILYISVAFYVVYSFYLMIKYRKSINFGRWLSLVILVLGMLIAVVSQYLFPRYPVEMFANAIGLLFISVMVQRPEEIIDVESGAKSRSAFASDMQRAFDNSKCFDVLVLKLLNLHSYGDILSYDENVSLLQEIRSRLQKLSMQNEADAEIYYLRDSTFALVVDEGFRGKSLRFAEQIYDSSLAPVALSNMQINLISSVCVINCPEDIGEFSELTAYITHSVGSEKGGIVRAHDEFSSGRYEMIINMDAIINRALNEGGFEVYYQPIFAVGEKRFNSAEALLRLKDPKFGFVPPDIFIPVAEKNGTIHRIGLFVLESVCRFIASKEFEALGLDYIEVNLSVVQCMNKTLADDIIGIMKKYGVGFDKINLEITESFAAHYQNTMASNIKKLLDAGITFALDDFGTGYSNMQSIASLPLVITKLDKTFVNMESTEKMTVVVERSIDMIKALKMKIVVEGVETREMLERFSDLGCEYIQGYYFSRPLPEREFENYITQHQNKPEE